MPSFSRVHVVKTLLTLSNQPTSRKTLLERLELGEGSIKTILKKLKSDGLVASSQQGHHLTRKGLYYVKKLLDKFTPPAQVNLAGIVDGESVYTIVHNSADRIDSIVEYRDKAVKAGADGALLITYRRGRLSFPGSSLETYPGLKKRLDGLGLSENDAIVVTFSRKKYRAEEGALAIALDLTGS